MQSVDFSHDGQYLLTSSKDNTACLWTTGSSEPVLAFKYQSQAASTSSKVSYVQYIVPFSMHVDFNFCGGSLYPCRHGLKPVCH